MSGPLRGVKVIDLSLLLPGPLCSMYLADMGAEVIKVENPRAYDGTRAMVKSDRGLPGLFFMTNRNKKAITLNLKKEQSKEITSKIDSGDLSSKPGWVRLSLHPVMTEQDVHFICDAIEQIAVNSDQMLKSYRYSLNTNEFYPLDESHELEEKLAQWFNLEFE